MSNPNINTSERLFDLVRYMRSALHEGGLITDQEYAWLCSDAPMATSPSGGSPSARRLEEYGEMKKRIASLEKDGDELEKLLRFAIGDDEDEDWANHIMAFNKRRCRDATDAWRSVRKAKS